MTGSAIAGTLGIPPGLLLGMIIPASSAPALVSRVRNILLSPKTEWPVIRAEPATAADMFKRYVMPLALIPALAGLVGVSFIGVGALGYSFRVPVVAALSNAVIGYLLTLVMVAVLAWLVNALAPTFGGQPDRLGALKTVAYSFTAAWLGGIFSLLPSLAVLGLIASLYSIYLLYLGLPVLMRVPAAKSAGYTAVTVVCGIVLGALIAAVSALLLRAPAAVFGAADDGPAAGLSVRSTSGEVQIDRNRIDAWSRQMEAAGRRMEEAGRAGDAASMAQAGAEMARSVGIAAGGGRTPLTALEMEGMLPDTVLGLPRTSLRAETGPGAGLVGAIAEARYADASAARKLTLSIVDPGSNGSTPALARTAGAAGNETKNDDRVERSYGEGTRAIHETARKDGSGAEVSMVLQSGVIVTARSEGGVDLPTLKAAAAALPISTLESMPKP